MEIIEFCFLAMTYLISRSNSYEIIPDGTAWLGENITLRISDIPNMKRPVVWQSKNYKYECDRTCANGDHIVTQDGNVSTLTIKNISWEFSKWSFMDDNIRGALLELDIKVKPKIRINVIKECVYNVTAQCSLPVTLIQCFIGKNPAATQRNKCSDKKTITNSARLNLGPSVSGQVKCIFTIDDIFEEKQFFNFTCDATPKPIAGNDTPSGFYIFRSCKSLLLGIIIADNLFKN
ncbi:uncharacterized protein LOC106876057 isoform X2 [Octopus bimaculoides]|uniref:Uncharacterized protein n=3 Tax=Octopus bimaculoides TaxID=37653 RepID=A0A0L8GLR6_OCTBM|nr:uncharacterized protein LOC106876057 isoform X2 [Octopus bimaculoides]|eukprot:XP_014779945.1 PREDICTED: uncharacterized protein LOC106876057 isoform X2 [Octopus bimaculoides]